MCTQNVSVRGHCVQSRYFIFIYWVFSVMASRSLFANTIPMGFRLLSRVFLSSLSSVLKLKTEKATECPVPSFNCDSAFGHACTMPINVTNDIYVICLYSVMSELVCLLSQDTHPLRTLCAAVTQRWSGNCVRTRTNWNAIRMVARFAFANELIFIVHMGFETCLKCIVDKNWVIACVLDWLGQN